MKRLVKNALARFDVGVHRLSALAPAEAEGFDASVLPDADAIIDVGVAYGTGWLYQRYPDAQLVLVDPVPSPDLDACLAGREHTMVSAALGAAEGRAEMTVNLAQSGASSLLQRTELTRTGAPTEVRSVEVTTLDRVASTHVPAGARIGLKLDTEGYELEVLRGGLETLERCSFVVCEASVLRRFEDSYRFEELVCFLRDHGFGVAAVLGAERDRQQRVRFLDLAFLPYEDAVRRNR